MARRSDIKGAIDTQLDVAIDLVEAARHVNEVRKRLEAEGRTDEATELRASIERMVTLSDRLTDAAKAASRAWLEEVRASW